jgi:hypothetical protein
MNRGTPAGDHARLERLESTVRTELMLAENGQPAAGAEGVAASEQPPDTDAERYEAALGSLLGAVEAVEGAAREET